MAQQHGGVVVDSTTLTRVTQKTAYKTVYANGESTTQTSPRHIHIHTTGPHLTTILTRLPHHQSSILSSTSTILVAHQDSNNTSGHGQQYVTSSLSPMDLGLIAGFVGLVVGAVLGVIALSLWRKRRESKNAGAYGKDRDTDDRGADDRDQDSQYSNEKGGALPPKKRDFLAALGIGKNEDRRDDRGPEGQGRARDVDGRSIDGEERKGGFLSSCLGGRRKDKGPRGSSVSEYHDPSDSRVRAEPSRGSDSYGQSGGHGAGHAGQQRTYDDNDSVGSGSQYPEERGF